MSETSDSMNQHSTLRPELISEVVVATAKITEEEKAAAELVRLAKRKEEEEKEKKRWFDEEVARRKVAQALKPKAKGLVIEDVPKKSIPTYKGKGKGTMYEDEPQADTESETEPTHVSKSYAERKIEQIEQDEVVAKKIHEELEKELMEEEIRKKKEEIEQDEVLKQTDRYSGKQLRPMKMSTLRLEPTLAQTEHVEPLGPEPTHAHIPGPNPALAYIPIQTPGPEPAHDPEPEPVQTRTEPVQTSRAEIVLVQKRPEPVQTSGDEIVPVETQPEPEHALQDLFADDKRDDFFDICVPLYKASINGDWIAAKAILQKHQRNLVKYSITDNRETMLHVAASTQNTFFVQNLVAMMQPDDLKYRNLSGNTALCLAAITGNTDIARILVDKNPDLLTMPNDSNVIPLYIAVLYGKRDMVDYLYNEINNLQVTYENIKWACLKCVEVDLFDIALRIYQNHPEVAERENQSILGVLARKPNAFNEQKQPIIRRIVNSVTCCKQIPITNTDAATQLLTHILESIKMKPKKDIYDILRGPVLVTLSGETQILTYPSRVLFVAAELGNTKFIVELIRKYPDLIWKINDNSRSIFHVAVSHRHESIYNLLYDIGSMKDLLVVLKDPEENNMLHLVGKMVDKNRLKDVSGAAFQMQLELLWYKEVESMIPPSYRERKNRKGETPYELFTRTHKDLLSEGEKWMRGTASKCMLVATLIATIVFGVAFTIPGGYDEKSGFPQFLHNGAFIAFVALDAISLFLSSTSILVFLSILTSRYAQEDFIKSLPKKLMVGLSMLFLSIATMMIAFAASFFVLYRHKFIIAAGFISLFAIIPIVSYPLLQYSLLVDLFHSTFGSTNIFKPKKQMLYSQNPRYSYIHVQLDCRWFLKLICYHTYRFL